MLPLKFEKHKICSNRTKSLLIVNPILPANAMIILQWRGIFLLNLTLFSTMLQATIRLVKLFKRYF